MNFNLNTEGLNNQFKQLAEMQARSIEPMRVFGSLAADATEQVLRKNYELMGDWVDFAVKQAQIPASGANVGDVAQAQVAETTAFAEQMNARAQEYVELANNFGQKFRDAAGEAAATVKAVA